MRTLLLAALAIVLATPAPGQQGPLDQYAAAWKSFALGLDSGALARGRYYEAMRDDLDGTWIDTAVLDKVTDPTRARDLIALSCDRQPIALTAPAPYTITLTQTVRDIALDIVFTYVGGTSFSAYTDSTLYLGRFGLLDDLDSAREQALSILSTLNAEVSIVRPSADVLVLMGDRRAPQILVRCRATSPAPADAAGDAELKDALGSAFARLFTSEDQQARDAFVACAFDALSPLSTSDRRMVIDSDFNPPSDEQDRIDAAHPGMKEAARACAQAAQEATGSTAAP